MYTDRQGSSYNLGDKALKFVDIPRYEHTQQQFRQITMNTFEAVNRPNLLQQTVDDVFPGLNLRWLSQGTNPQSNEEPEEEEEVQSPVRNQQEPDPRPEGDEQRAERPLGLPPRVAELDPLEPVLSLLSIFRGGPLLLFRTSLNNGNSSISNNSNQPNNERLNQGPRQRPNSSGDGEPGSHESQ